MSKLQDELEEKFNAKKAVLIKELLEVSEALARSAKRLEKVDVLDSYLGIDGFSSVQSLNRHISELATIQDIACRAYLLSARESA